MPLQEADRRSASGGPPTAATGQNGAFIINDLRPGEYKALAVDSVAGRAWGDPVFAGRYEGKAAALKLKEGSRETLNLKLAREPGP